MRPALERLYRGLLRAYPAEYRAWREDEMVGTLLEVTRPGQRLPDVREAAGLIAGGLRTRARLRRESEGPAAWFDVLRIGAALLLSVRLLQSVDGFIDSTWLRPRLLPLVLAAVLITLLRRPVRAGLLLVAASLVLAWPLVVATPAGIVGWSTSPILFALALAAAVFLWPSGTRTSRRWPWAAIGILALAPWPLRVAELQGLWIPWPGWSTTLYEVLPGAFLIALTLVSADPRPSLGGLLYFAASALGPLALLLAGFGAYGYVRFADVASIGNPASWFAPALLASACLVTGAVARREAVRL